MVQSGMRKAKEKGTKQGERREDDEGRNVKGNEGATRWKTKMKEDGSVASYCTEIFFLSCQMKCCKGRGRGRR